MATLKNKTDDIAALEKLNKELDKYKKALKAKKDSPAEVKNKIKAKIKKIREDIKAGKTSDKEVTAKQLANSLLASRKKFLAMTNKDFNGVIRQLAKKPEYAFLKDYTREEVVRDIMRKAKPVGWRFKGRGDYRKPTPAQVRKGRANGTVYYENRPNRSDVSQTKQLAKGGYANAENPTHVLHIDGQNWYLEKIDSTHFYMSNSPDFRGMAHHIGQHKGEPYYEEVREWLKTTSMAKGGSTYAKGGRLQVKVYGKGSILDDLQKSSLTKYGGNSSFDFNTNKGWQFFAFDNKAERDEFIDYLKGKNIKFEVLGSTYAKGGSTYAKGGNTDNFKYAIIVTNTNNPYDNQSRVATVGKKGDAIIMLSALQMAAKNAPLDYSIVELYADGGFVPMSMAELEKQRMSEYENYSGEESEEDYDDGVTRQYFEEEAYSYEDGGEIDINDLDIPVHYTMFEDELYEYGKGGNLPQRTISNVTYKVIKDGKGYNVGVFHTGGSAWKVGKPSSKAEAVKLLNMLVEDKSKRTRN